MHSPISFQTSELTQRAAAPHAGKKQMRASATLALPTADSACQFCLCQESRTEDLRANHLFVQFSLKEKEEEGEEKTKDAHAGPLPRIIKFNSEFVPVAQHPRQQRGDF